LRPSPGIISSNWGGTIIQSWSDNATNAKCASLATVEPAELQLPVGVQGPDVFADHMGGNLDVAAQPGPNAGYGVLFNAMINPFVTS
jgi:hypothetical protein